MSVVVRAPWRRTKTLLRYRATGAYTPQVYQTMIRPVAASFGLRARAWAVAHLPGMLANVMGLVYYRWFHPSSNLELADMRSSRFYPFRSLTRTLTGGLRRDRQDPSQEGLPVTVVEHKACRVCGGSLVDILSLGSQYLSDFPAPGEAGRPQGAAGAGLVRDVPSGAVEAHRAGRRDVSELLVPFRYQSDHAPGPGGHRGESGGPDRLGSGELRPGHRLQRRHAPGVLPKAGHSPHRV